MMSKNDLTFLRAFQRNSWRPGDPGRPPGSKDKKRRANPRYFWSRAEIVDKFVARFQWESQGCWQWHGAQANGFGYMVIGSRQDNGGNPKRIQAHRLSWELYHSPIPPGMLVGQWCENKLCVRPGHLYLWRKSSCDSTQSRQLILGR